MAQSNGLDGWGYFGANEVDKKDTENPYGVDFLQGLKKYDPSAHWEQVNQYGGGEGGGDTTTMMRAVYDASKLPGGHDRPAMVDMNDGAFNGMYNDGGQHGYGGYLFKPDAITQDKDGYGAVTDPRNMNLVADNDTGPVARYAPMAIGLLATALSGGAAAPGLISAMTQAPQMLDQMSQGNYGGGASMFANLLRQYATSAMGPGG